MYDFVGPSVGSSETHYGFVIPVGPSGRRRWADEFKRFVSEEITHGRLTVASVSKSCRISENTLYIWKRQFASDTGQVPNQAAKPKGFTELALHVDPVSHTDDRMTIERGGVCLHLPLSYPPSKIAELLRAIEASA